MNALFSDNALTKEGPVEIILPPILGKSLYLFHKCIIVCDVAILGPEDKVIETNREVAPCQFFINSLFKTSQVFLNGVPVNRLVTF